jgi:hypothetical protein
VTLQRDDGTDPARRASTTAEDRLVARLQALSTEAAVTPDEQFRAATRARLVAMAAVRTPATEGATRRPPVSAGALRRLFTAGAAAPAPRWRTRLTAGLAGAALTVTALGGLLGAAQGARPGDLLYDLKRGGEQTQLALAGDSRRGTTLLGFASTRLDELEELVGVQPGADAVVGSTPSGGEAGLAAGPDVDLVLDTLQTMDAQTAEGTAALTSRAVQESDADALQLLTGWAADQQSGLGALDQAVPTGAQDALAVARDLVGEVETRGTDLQTALRCAGGPSTQGTDELGPVPAPCAVVPPTTTGTTTSSGSTATSGPATAESAPSAEPVPSAAVSATSSGPAGAVPTTAAGPTPSAPAAPTSTGGSVPSVPAPGTTSRPGLPLPLPTLLPPATTSAPSSSAGSVVSVPSIVPGVSVCLPPLLGVGC